jgi:4-carboxymuconolactone decarboxylase
MSSQIDRRNAGIDVLRTLTRVQDPQTAAQAMEARHGALGSFAIDHVLGNLWSRPQLSRRDRSLIVVTFLATLGATDELRVHVEGALNHGLSRAELEEIVNQVAGYAGFPLAMHAARIVAEVLAKADGVERLPARDAAAAKDDPERWADAAQVMTMLFAGRTPTDPAQARASIIESLGGVGEMAFDFGFGELWSRPDLSRRDRSMVTVAILALLSRVDELVIHVPGALNHGCTEEEIEEIMVQLTVYGGFPRAVEGMRATRDAFAKRRQ